MTRVSMDAFNRLVAFILAWFVMGFTATVGWSADAMHIGVLPVVDTLPLWVAKERGYFVESGIDVTLLSFDSALERDAALQAGKLEGYFGDLLNTVLLIRSGHPIRVATVAYHTDVTQRMFGVALQPGSKIRHPDQLADQTIGISRSTVIEFLLDRMLIGSGVPTSAVQKQDIKKIPIRMQLLLSGQIPAALLPEPLLSLAELKGARVILDDRRLDMTETVIALKKSWVDAGTELLKRFRLAYGKAVETIRREPETTTDILVRHCRLPNELVPSYRPPVFPPVGLPSSGDIELVQQWLIEHQMILKPMDERDIVFSP
ncbi:ABC transporter substrate-binding protein [Desulfatirhabdium butyrativorans]|uniref:ABC transporter substrate-binding protein n=1 Tax=Desulfatirhabdium butyrativorans TaxID=340467 RepID=UPI00042049D0|nr:ABC transporter substrate-binding protein [Desulfatirhabdium butyrativorans]